MVVIAKKYLIIKHFQGLPKRSDLTLVKEELPPLKDGEFLLQAEYLTVDPYMKLYNEKLPLGSTMIGTQLAKIIESKYRKNAFFPVGRRVSIDAGWRTHTVASETTKYGLFELVPDLIPDFDDLPASLGLGVLGAPGHTSYILMKIGCQPKAGQTLVVSGAAGACGSHAGQIGKIHGLKVIGIAGTDAKCKWLKEELGFDEVINYKTQDVASALKKAAPEKVDCYFDNVGGEISDIVISQMKDHGRVAICGAIAMYNDDPTSWMENPPVNPDVALKKIKMDRYAVHNYQHLWAEAFEQNLKWVREGKLKYRETITKGFEKMYDAFVGVLKGDNVGKAVVAV